jgi:hypothetical protein
VNVEPRPHISIQLAKDSAQWRRHSSAHSPAIPVSEGFRTLSADYLLRPSCHHSIVAPCRELPSKKRHAEQTETEGKRRLCNSANDAVRAEITRAIFQIPQVHKVPLIQSPINQMYP